MGGSKDDVKDQYGGIGVNPDALSAKSRQALQDGQDIFNQLRRGDRVPAMSMISLGSALAHAATEINERFGPRAAMSCMQAFRGAFFMVLRSNKTNLSVPFDAMPGPKPGVSDVFGG